MSNPLAAPAIAFALGIVVSRASGLDMRDLWWGTLALAAIAVFAHYRAPRIQLPAILILMGAGGALVDAANRPGAPPTLDASSQETVLLSGCVVDPALLHDEKDEFTLELAPGARARVSVHVREGEELPPLRYGQMAEVEARVRAVRNFQNPGSFDYAGFLARQHIYWNASVSHASGVRVQPGRCGSRFLAAVFALRMASLGRIEQLYGGNAYATGMMEAILIGESRKLEKVWTEQFRRTGTFHALVISGLHVSVLAGTLLFLLRVCFVREMPALLITALAAWVYALVSGWSAPVVRAAGGFTFFLAGRYFYRRRHTLNLLAAVALLYLGCDPGQLFDASFQLSFFSVAVIAAIAAPILERTSAPYAGGLKDMGDTRRDWRLPPRVAQLRVELRLVAETLHLVTQVPEVVCLAGVSVLGRVALFAYESMLISAVVQVGLALPMAFYFHSISFSGLTANVIIVPLLSLVVPVGFVAVFTGWSVPAKIAEMLLRAAAAVAQWHGQWEPPWRVPDPPFWLAAAFAVALVVLGWALHRDARWRWAAALATAALFAAVLIHPFPPQTGRGILELTAIDVGQGDSILITAPSGKQMLVDGGGFPALGRRIKPKLDIGEDVVSPYLWRLSVKRIDTAVATHAHEDHVEGLFAIIENFRPRELWTGANAGSPIWMALRAKAEACGVRVRPLLAGQSLDFGGAQVQVLSPPADYLAGEKPKNDDSLVLRLSYGTRSFLLTGDVEKGMEARMLESGLPLTADVLKVAHHGSRTSSIAPFLDAVHPRFAVISDGFENLFHHPHPDVIERLRERHIEVLRTDLRGLVRLRTDGQRIEVE